MKSSLELFALSLYEKGLLQGNGNHIDDLLLHFKAMHKEEIQLAFQSGKLDAAKHIFNETESKDSEQYYNETYGGNK